MSTRTIKVDGSRATPWEATWLPILYAIAVAVLMAARASVPLRIVYLLGALAVGFRLQRLSPPAYVGFMLWMWFLTPLVRRVADLYASWQDPSILLLTPYLVTGLSAVPIVERLFVRGAAPLARPAGMAMFGLAAAGAAAGIPLGLATGVDAAVVETLNFLTPLLLGWYIATRSEHLHEIERQVTRTFIRGALVAAAYGIYQFGNPPPWDIAWMLNAEMGSIGLPEPFMVRIFGTMNGPGVLAVFLTVAVVLWLAKPHTAGMPAAGITGVALLLTQVRSAWVAFLVSAVLVVASLRPAQQLRAVVLVGLAALGMGALLLTPEMSELLDTRLASMENLDEDTSANARLLGHELALEFVTTNPLGVGIGQGDTTIEYFISMRDSIIVAAIVQFGLVGATLYFIAMFLLFAQLFRYYRRGASPEGVALACAALGLVAISWLGVTTAGPMGICVWLVAGLAVADRHRARLRAARVLMSTRSRIRSQAPRHDPVPV